MCPPSGWAHTRVPPYNYASFDCDYELGKHNPPSTTRAPKIRPVWGHRLKIEGIWVQEMGWRKALCFSPVPKTPPHAARWEQVSQAGG